MLLLDPRRCSWVGLLALTREDTATMLLELLLPFFHLYVQGHRAKPLTGLTGVRVPGSTLERKHVGYGVKWVLRLPGPSF